MSIKHKKKKNQNKIKEKISQESRLKNIDETINYLLTK